VFHAGEVIGYKGSDDDDWESLTVVTGYCDWPVKRMMFATEPGQRPWWIERHNPPGVLAVLQRQSDGVRFLLDSETWELREQREGRSERFDWRDDREPASQFDDATGRSGPMLARRAISRGGVTLREPAVGD
jgi:hypothetical protein